MQRAKDLAQLVECLSYIHKALGSLLALHKQVWHRTPVTLKTQRGGRKEKNQEFTKSLSATQQAQANQGYMKHYLKKNNKAQSKIQRKI